MKFAYADPPYIGQAKKHYGNEATYAGEVDHAALIDRLVTEYPDGWALSCSSPSLYTVLHMLQQRGLSLLDGDYRVMQWVKPFASFKPNVGVAYAYEPVIVMGGRKRTREQLTVRDWVSANITLEKGLSGVKPLGFCFWLFEVLNIQDDDTLDDLFPGSRSVTKALEQWRSRLVLEA